jgi:hypothetical protein
LQKGKLLIAIARQLLELHVRGSFVFFTPHDATTLVYVLSFARSLLGRTGSHLIHYIHYGLEGKGFVGCQICQYLAIHLNICFLQSWNKGRVSPIVLPRSTLNALNPQLAPLSALHTSIPIGILPCLFDPPNGNAKAVFGSSPKPLCMFQQILVL